MHPLGTKDKLQMVLKLFALSSHLPADMENKSCLGYLVICFNILNVLWRQCYMFSSELNCSSVRFLLFTVPLTLEYLTQIRPSPSFDLKP